MTSSQPGWYPDPAGDTTKLRYWDGMQWTDSLTDAAQFGVQAPVAATPNAFAADPGAQTTTNVYNVTVQQQQGGYPRPDGQSNLLMVAFIFALLSTLAVCWLILPLAWMIPMTVHTWGIYKGRHANTVGFGVCMLLFCGLIAGILLLVAEKDR